MLSFIFHVDHFLKAFSSSFASCSLWILPKPVAGDALISRPAYSMSVSLRPFDFSWLRKRGSAKKKAPLFLFSSWHQVI